MSPVKRGGVDGLLASRSKPPPRANRPPATPIPGTRIDFAPNSLLQSKMRRQFPARANEFPARPRREFTLQATEFADAFETDFRGNTANSAKFTAFFPATRELCTSGDREFIHGSPQRAGCRETAVASEAPMAHPIEGQLTPAHTPPRPPCPPPTSNGAGAPAIRRSAASARSRAAPSSSGEASATSRASARSPLQCSAMSTPAAKRGARALAERAAQRLHREIVGHQQAVEADRLAHDALDDDRARSWRADPDRSRR